MGDRDERPSEYASKARRPTRLLKLQDHEAGALESLREAVRDLPSESVEMLLFAYAASGQPHLLGTILQINVVDVNTKRTKDGCTALHVASYKQNADVVEVL